jgi:hypothetical protein
LFFTIGVAFALFIIGCESRLKEPIQTVEDKEQQPQNQTSIYNDDSKIAVSDQVVPESTPTLGKETEAKNAIEVASPQTKEVYTNNDDLYWSEDDREWMQQVRPEQDEPLTRYDVLSAFDPNLLRLMGLALGQSSQDVSRKFGSPAETFELPENDLDASVLVYPGFMVGILNEKILFIEVNTRSVNPGLNGLRLGDSSESIDDLLGHPATITPFLITYKSEGAILKLDIDPQTQKIHSMKLFPAE